MFFSVSLKRRMEEGSGNQIPNNGRDVDVEREGQRDQSEEDTEQTELNHERDDELDSGDGRQIEDQAGVVELPANADNDQELNDEDQELYRRYQNLYRQYQRQYQEFQEEYGETDEQQEENGDMRDHGEYDEEQYREYFEQFGYGGGQEGEGGEEMEKGGFDNVNVDVNYEENIQMGAIIQDAIKTEDESLEQDAIKTEDESLENSTEAPGERDEPEETADYSQEGNLPEDNENEYSDGEANLMITENGVTSVTYDESIRMQIQPTDEEYETALLMGGEIMFDDVQIDEDDESENEEKPEIDEEQEVSFYIVE